MSKDAKTSTGLVQAGTKSLAAGGEAGGPVVDMQDLLPVIQSFQDHMAAEQVRQRSRIRSLVTVFVLALVAALALTLWVVRSLFLDHQEALAAQRAEQAQTSKSLELALREVAEASRALRVELSHARTVDAPPAVAAPVEKATPVLNPPVPAPAPAVKPSVTNEPTATPPVTNAPPPEMAGTKTVDVPSNKTTQVSTDMTSTNAPASVSVAPDLEQQLRLIEQSIMEKQRQLQQKSR